MATDRKSNDYYIGVDVGTGSARAALVACDGEIVAESTYPTTTYRDDHNHDIFEQSTTESEHPCTLDVIKSSEHPCWGGLFYVIC
jgi:ribulose kinase